MLSGCSTGMHRERNQLYSPTNFEVELDLALSKY